MNKVSCVLLCCSTFLYACDSSNDAANKNVSDANVKAAAGPGSVKENESDTMGAAVDSAGGAVGEAADIIQGESIYKSKCFACHGTGAAGAPKLGDKAAWGPRIAQGNAILYQHAIEGFKGNRGYMPPKGGFMNLSDHEISIAIQYMVSQSQ